MRDERSEFARGDFLVRQQATLVADVKLANAGNASALEVLMIWRKSLNDVAFGVVPQPGTRIELPVVVFKDHPTELKLNHLAGSDEMLSRKRTPMSNVKLLMEMF